MKFKTNIKCEGCIAKVTPFLNDAVGNGNWDVDLQNPAKTLTVKNQTDADQIKTAVEKAGYKAEKLEQ